MSLIGDERITKMAREVLESTSPLADDSASNGRWGRILRRGAFVGLGLAGLLLSGFPVWAARRVIYPVSVEPLVPLKASELAATDGTLPERVEFASLESNMLSGWFLPGPPSSQPPWATVLLVYGYGGYKEQMIEYARMLHRGGFATLMFDMRGAGLRRGEAITLGYRERWDLIGAARYLTTRPDVDSSRIGALGVSLGGATILLAAAEEPLIRAIVADSSFADLSDMIEPGIQAFVGPFAVPFAPLLVRYSETALGIKSRDVSPARAAAQMGNRPILVIHCAEDALTHPTSADRIYEAAEGPKELWVVPGCEHAMAPVAAGIEYEIRVNGFLSKWLNDPEPSARTEQAG